MPWGLRLVFTFLREVTQSCPTLCNPMDTKLFHPWDFLGKSTGVVCHFLLQGIFLTQGWNPGLLHCRQMLLPSEPPGKSHFKVLLKQMCFVAAWMGGAFGRKWIHVYIWLSLFTVQLRLSHHCLLISYTLIQNKKFLKKHKK